MSILTLFNPVGSFFIFVGEIFKTALRVEKIRQRLILPFFEQLISVYTRSLGIVIFSGVFVGAILVLQFNTMLLQHDAQALLGGLNTSALVREVGPLIISFLLAGKIGAFTAAELGTMRVTDQMDAMDCLGTDPMEYLVVPRFFAILVASQLLLLVGIVVGVIGSVGVATALCGVNSLQFLGAIPKFTGPWTLFCGFAKCFVYGFIVAGVSCYEGYNTNGGAQGVGRSVTRAAVFTNFYIVLANYFTSHFLRSFAELFNL